MNSRPNRPDPRPRWASVMLLFAVVLTGCVTQDPPGVGMQVVAADIGFGLPETPEPVPPPTFLDLPTFEVPAPTAPPVSAGPPPLPRPIAVADCPTANLSAVPAELAADNVAPDRRPAEGRYLWYVRGKVRLAELLFTPVPLEIAYRVDVYDVQSLTETLFTYWTRSRNRLGVTVERMWQVRTDGGSVGASDLPLVPTIDIPYIPEAGVDPPEVGLDPETVPRVGEPDRGVSLREVHYYDSAGNEIGDGFVPTVPLLVLPLPIRVAESFSSQTTDPVTQQQWAFTDAEVRPPVRVDACGELVEGYAVRGTLQFVDSEGTPTTTRPDGFRLVIVPQLGGLVVLEEAVVGLDGAEGYELTDTIGQLVPSKVADR